jgi:3-oxoacyl-[acyl-carrier protein] reductase
MQLDNRIIAVTGSARGIGLGLAQALRARGARLALLDINAEGLQTALATLNAPADAVRTYACDVGDEAQVTAAFAAIRADFGTLHGLVNNAGILRDGLLLKVKEGRVIGKMSAADYALVVDVHMKGAFLCAREAAAIMVETAAADGCLVNISSLAADGNFGQSNYSAAKAGMIAQSRVWAKELGRYGIRSMAIAPGTIDTDMLRSMPAEQYAAIARAVPVGRIGNVDHIAQAVIQIFENDYLSGSVIEVSGGLRI